MDFASWCILFSSLFLSFHLFLSLFISVESRRDYPLKLPLVVEEEEEDFRAGEDRPDPPTQVLANDGRLPKGVHLILLGGIPCAGVKAASALLRAASESYSAPSTTNTIMIWLRPARSAMPT